jgi:hypothetical protein
MNTHQDAIEFLHFLTETFQSYEDKLSHNLMLDLMENWLHNEKVVRTILSNHQVRPRQMPSKTQAQLPPPEPARPELDPIPGEHEVTDPKTRGPGRMIHVPAYTITRKNGQTLTVLAHDRWRPDSQKPPPNNREPKPRGLRGPYKKRVSK